MFNCLHRVDQREGRPCVSLNLSLKLATAENSLDGHLIYRLNIFFEFHVAIVFEEEDLV